MPEESANALRLALDTFAMVAFRSFWALGLLAGTAVAKFDYIGINEAGPEFGEKKIPGVLNKDVRHSQSRAS